MTEEKAHKIYDLLVELGGAPENMRENFVYHHTNRDGCDEYRFQGKLGFGGKYRSQTNTVDCYQEDETPARKKLITEINSELEYI